MSTSRRCRSCRKHEEGGARPLGALDVPRRAQACTRSPMWPAHITVRAYCGTALFLPLDTVGCIQQSWWAALSSVLAQARMSRAAEAVSPRWVGGGRGVGRSEVFMWRYPNLASSDDFQRFPRTCTWTRPGRTALFYFLPHHTPGLIIRRPFEVATSASSRCLGRKRKRWLMPPPPTPSEKLLASET